MKVLGIHEGHTATACILVDGRVAGMASEERFNRRKGWGAFPSQAVRWALEYAGLRGADIDAIALSTLLVPVFSWKQSESLLPRRVLSRVSGLLPASLLGSTALVPAYLRLARFRQRKLFQQVETELRALDLPVAKVRRYEHHHCHAATVYHTLPKDIYAGGAVLLVTLDCSGDGISGTVAIGEGGKIRRLRSWSSYHSIGEIYGYVTRYLGLTPNEHEYKVMGLAPYASEYHSRRAYEVLQGYFGLSEDGLEVRNHSGAWGERLLGKLERDLRETRFDAVAAAIQRRTEEVIVGLVTNWIQKTGIRRVAFSGGVFMNVKVNMVLNELPEAEQLFFFPSCGDESNPLGAALTCYVDECRRRGSVPDLAPLESLYAGPEYTSDEVAQAVAAYEDRVVWERCEDIEARVVKHLAQGEIVGRLAGRMEWGARSLGNRSILADARDLRSVRRINSAIKERDFWMPFAPSILFERRHDYLVNPRDSEARHMILAFRTSALAQRDLIAALHPQDLTCRPHVVEARLNPRYHRLLQLWEEATGCGGLLNTSLNLHGEPVVCSPKDAIETLLRSDLDVLALEDHLVRRRNSS